MNCPKRPAIVLVTLLTAAMAAYAAHAVEVDARNAALRSITSAEIKEYVGALADDTFEGRESGSRGGRAAGIYIVERLKRFGLTGGGDKGSYYQNFNNFHNILALCEGSDPALKAQHIVISAHFDHVGYGSARNSFGPVGHIHNGADDNASGVAALLEVAEAVSKLPSKPKRSILFAFWDGEEKGLLGSQHWVEHPTVPLKDVPIMINADMVGRLRNRRVEVYGVRTSRGLRRLVSRQNDIADLTLDFNWDIKADSDHHTFFLRGIPLLMMHTGQHSDYHRPSDDADKINCEGLAQVAQLMFGVLVELADAPSLAGFRRQAQSESRYDERRSEAALPLLPGRLGIRWDDQLAEKSGAIVVASITPGSAADKAGLRRLDKVVRFADHDVSGAAQFRTAVLTAKNPVAAIVERPGEAEPMEVTLQLAGEPVRLGITWRTDEAEPNCVILNRVTPGSPADVAGLRVNDRVHAISGQEFESGEQFRQLTASLPDPITLEVETAGRVRKVEIPTVTPGSAKDE